MEKQQKIKGLCKFCNTKPTNFSVSCHILVDDDHHKVENKSCDDQGCKISNREKVTQTANKLGEGKRLNKSKLYEKTLNVQQEGGQEPEEQEAEKLKKKLDQFKNIMDYLLNIMTPDELDELFSNFLDELAPMEEGEEDGYEGFSEGSEAPEPPKPSKPVKSKPVPIPKQVAVPKPVKKGKSKK